MKKICGVILAFCALSGLLLVPVSADFSVTPMLAAGGNHSVALDSTGVVWAWGANEHG